MTRKVKPGKTLHDLGAKVGSRVYYDSPEFEKRGYDRVVAHMPSTSTRSDWFCTEGKPMVHDEPYWHFVDDDTQAKPVLWRDDTPENKGAVLLALYEHRVVEVFLPKESRWVSKILGPYGLHDHTAYRVKPPAPPTTDIIITFTGNVVTEPTENLRLRRITLPLDTAGNAITGTFTDDAGNQIIIEDTSHD